MTGGARKPPPHLVRCLALVDDASGEIVQALARRPCGRAQRVERGAHVDAVAAGEHALRLLDDDARLQSGLELADALHQQGPIQLMLHRVRHRWRASASVGVTSTIDSNPESRIIRSTIGLRVTIPSRAPPRCTSWAASPITTIAAASRPWAPSRSRKSGASRAPVSGISVSRRL